MAGRRGWLRAVRRTFISSSCKTIAVLDDSTIERTKLEEETDIAAIKIQAYFRGHLARRAFRALRSLVKLQALVRGVCVRRQARVANHCMQALVRLQVRVRARQLLSRSGDAELTLPIYETDTNCAIGD